ncbi:MAG: gliding motility-associated C-terminal domain-containing protein [Spirochaetaceae bacterium]|jgi:flagellar hook assembly protein FlgD/outer membrane protein OmpA-like peptidoglycan-associated protein|nr:gliding motility-associated C-terminal domain-containing protein [Spirochaetaceae bacterium]
MRQKTPLLYCSIFALLASARLGFAAPEAPVKYLSPNNDGVQDNLTVNFTIKEKRYITEWRLSIEDASGRVIRTISNKEARPPAMNFVEFWKALFRPKRSVQVPRSVVWDGRTDWGSVVPDGVYTYYLYAKNDNGKSSESERRTAVVDCTPPDISIQPPAEADKFFGAGSKAELRIGQRGVQSNMPADRWTGIFADAQGYIHKTFTWEGNPADVRWLGDNDAGFPVPDGLYFYSVTGVDLAGNRSAPVRINNIMYSGDKPQTNISISGSRYFSNNPESPQHTITLVPYIPHPATGNLLKEWKIELIDNGGRGKAVRSWPVSLADNRIPQSLTLDGTDGRGHLLPDGAYSARVSASYLNGYNTPAVLSPQFYLKSTPPAGALAVREPKNRVFSPGSGIGREYIIFDEMLELTTTRWRAEIRGANGNLIRAFDRGAGTESRKNAANFWDGFDESGKLCADGDYYYLVFTTDLAGNPSRVRPVTFSIDTQKTELIIRAALAAFSPNGDGIQDTITFIPYLKSPGIETYQFDIINAERHVVKTISGNGNPPAQFVWDGKDNSGVLAPDNRYAAILRVSSRNSSAPVMAVTQNFLLRTHGPAAVVNPAAPLSSISGALMPVFSPDGDGRKDTLRIDIQSTVEDEWTGIFTDAKGTTVWRRAWHNDKASSFDWDGTDDSGNPLPDGKYTFTLSAADIAGNSIRVSSAPLTLDRRPAAASLTIASDYLAPYGRDKTQNWTVNAAIRDGIQHWEFAVIPAGGRTRAPVKISSGDGDTLPSKFDWDGKLDDLNAIAEGEFTGLLTIIYWKGNIVQTESPSFICTGTAPQISVSTTPEFFSPDNDGTDDELSINLRARSSIPLASWDFTVYDYTPPEKGKRGAAFWTISGGAQVTETALWNGRSNVVKGQGGQQGGTRFSYGELAQSATDYPYAFTVTDIEGQTSTVTGQITVDVLVIRDGSQLRIQVPAITFFPDTATFDGLAKDVLARNNWILGRIARALNRFKDYTVLVEGHANPVEGTKEEEPVLLSLSAARAAYVKQQLSKLGISGSRLTAAGVGAARPIPGVSPRDSINNWKNRRVEFILNKGEL